MRNAISNGESIPKTVKSLREVSGANAVTAKRVVRTAMTNAQNLGRMAGYEQAAALGIKGKVELIATMDRRVRHSHALLEGEQIEVGGKFSNGCRYPGDPNGAGSEIYNCRCTTGFSLDGIEDDSNACRIADNGMSYDEWKEYHFVKATKIYRKIERNLSNGLRKPTSHILTDQEIAQVITAAEEIDIDTSILRFNEGSCTCYFDESDVIFIRGNVFPDVNSSHNRDRMSIKSVLAHEYYGHRSFRLNELEAGSWKDEFRASYVAAIKTPNLTQEERAMLMIDAYERAEEVGIILKKTRIYNKIVYGDGLEE